MITREEARQSVLDRLNKRGVGGREGVVVLDAKTIDKSYGWAFFYNSKKFIETGDIMESLVGGGPVVVIAVSGDVHELGSARPPLVEVADLERRLGLRP